MVVTFSITSTALALPISIVPEHAGSGGQVQFIIDEQPASASRQVYLRGDGFSWLLADIVVDSRGQYVGVASLPLDLPSALYWIDLSSSVVLIDSTPLTIDVAPTIELHPESGYPGQRVTIDVSGFSGGTLAVLVDDRLTIGPVPADGAFHGDFRIPDGGPELLPVVVEQRVGRLLVSRAERGLSRLAPVYTTPQSLTVNRPPSPFTPSQLATLTGRLFLPSGSAPDDFDWTLAWQTSTGAVLPVNVSPVSFDPDPGGDDSFGFSVAMVSPGLRAGFPPGEYNSGVDGLGFVYRNPETGQSGFLRAFGVNGYDDYEGIVITGRVTDGSGTAIEGAIYSVTAETLLIDPDSVQNQASKAAPGTYSGTAAVIHGNNQFVKALEGLQVSPFTAAGCPITLYYGATQADGTYLVAFSPELTEFLNTITDIPPPDINTSVGPGNHLDQFRVRLSALHLGFGVPQPGTSVYTGIVYDFQRNPDDGVYYFREGLEGDFNQPFNPLQTLESELPPLPPARTRLLPSNPYIPKLADPVTELRNNQATGVIRRLTTFPGRAGGPLDDVLTEIRLPWAPASFGELDATLFIENQLIGPLAVGDGNSCILEGIDYSIQVPGLATRGASGVIHGRIEGGTPTGNYFKNFEIITEPGLTWFENTDSYAGASIYWTPEMVRIAADEQDKTVTNNVQQIEYGVGDLNNDNQETATVTQQISMGWIGEQVRGGLTSTTVAGNASKLASKLYVNGLSSFDWSSNPAQREFEGWAKNARDDLYARAAQGETPTIGSASPNVILDTGKIPIFRYMWGLQPIAGATLGADIWFKVLFTYFGYIDAYDDAVDLGVVAEPATEVGLDVFFDFSAIFGLVSASMTASPIFGISMPVIIMNNTFDTEASVPCFQFVLDLAFEVEVGICPLCVGAEHTERAIDRKQPSGCAVLQPVKSAKLATAPSADSISVSNNAAGTSFTVWADVDTSSNQARIHAQKMVGGVPDTEYVIPAGPGAMRPAVAFYDVNDAVLVWSQSSLSLSDYLDKVAADYSGQNTSQFDGTVDQFMVYSRWDGSEWGPVQGLTVPNTGEGGVELAACVAGASGCPPGGEVMAVWHRDMAGDIDQGDIKLYHAFFNGLAWTAPMPLDLASTAKDVQPAPVYMGGEPVVVWIRNPSPDAQNPGTGEMGLEERRLVYRFIREAAGVQDAVGLPTAAASPSAVSFSNGTLGVAFTSTDAGAPFVGARRALWLATGENCSNGSCDWNAYQQRDQHSRPIFVEHPAMVVDEQDRAMVAFRQLGVDGELRADDPVGLRGFGDVAKIEFGLADLGLDVFTQPLSVDGAVNWQVAAAYDPSLNSLLIVNSKDQSLAKRQFRSSAKVPGMLVTQQLASDRGVTAYALPHLPDLAVTSVESATLVIYPAQQIDVEVNLVNQGMPINLADVVDVGLYWDGPAGYGEPAAPLISFNPSGGARMVARATVTVPQMFTTFEIHRLYATVNPNGSVGEGDSSNNSQFITFNEIPVPANVVPSVDLSGTLVFLDWDDLGDGRVGHYRIYRRHVETLEEFAVGFTPVNGFVDLNVIPRETYQYRLTAVTATLLESAPTDWITVAVLPERTDLMFANGFESP